MSTSTVIRKVELPPTPMRMEHQYGPSDNLGEHASTMELFWYDGDVRTGRGCIEWDIPTMDDTWHIGIWTAGGALVDYDGVFELPKEAVKLLRQAGIRVGREFTC